MSLAAANSWGVTPLLYLPKLFLVLSYSSLYEFPNKAKDVLLELLTG